MIFLEKEQRILDVLRNKGMQLTRELHLHLNLKGSLEGPVGMWWSIMIVNLMEVIATKETNLLSCLKNFLDEIYWDGKTHFKCRCHHSRHFVPRLNEKQKLSWVLTTLWWNMKHSCTKSSTPRCDTPWNCEPQSALPPSACLCQVFYHSNNKS